MKTSFKLIMAGILLTPLALLLAVGQPAGAQTPTSNNANSQSANQTAPAEDPATKQAKLKERIDARKAELKLRLTNAQQQRIKARCKAAQGLIGPMGARLENIGNGRTQKHTNIVQRLESASVKLKEHGSDVAQLDAQIAEVKKLVAAFDTELANYKQLVADLSAVDCVADPVGFKASLEKARIAHTSTKKAAEAIKAYLQTTLKPTLVQLRTQLNSTEEGA